VVDGQDLVGHPVYQLLDDLPVATLIVVAAGQAVLRLLLGPVMNRAWHQAFNWIAITLIILAAGWLVAALFTGSSSLAPLFGRRARG
jgi:hypothetical protein